MENMVRCSRCNNMIDSTKKFCKYCGQPVEQNQNQYQNTNQNQYQYSNQYQSQKQSYSQPQAYHQGYGASGTQNQPQAYSQTQAFSGQQPYQQTYGNQDNRQYDSQYPAQQPMTLDEASAWGGNQVKKKSNKKVIGIISAVVAVAVLAVVFFVFILPNISGSPQKTVKQLEKAIMTQNEELARDCFDAATLQEFSGPVLEAMDFSGSDMMMSGFNMMDYVKIEMNVLEVFDEGLPKNQCVVLLTGKVSLENIPQELQFLIDMAGEMMEESLEPIPIAMVKEGSKWKFSKPLTEELSDYIDRINVPY